MGNSKQSRMVTRAKDYWRAWDKMDSYPHGSAERLRALRGMALRFPEFLSKVTAVGEGIEEIPVNPEAHAILMSVPEAFEKE